MNEVERANPQAHVGSAHAATAPASPAAAHDKGAARAHKAAGAAVVSRILAEGDLKPEAPPAWLLGEENLLNGTLADFDAYAYAHPDWIAKIKDSPAGAGLWSLLVLVRASAGLAASLGSVPVRTLLAEDLQHGALARYARAVGTNTDSVELTLVPSLDRARKLGAALNELDTVIPIAVQKEILGGAQGGASFTELVDGGMLPAFQAYVRAVSPLLTGRQGAELWSFIRFFQETGGQVTRYVGRFAHLRNHHHFSVQTLERLATNETDTSRRRPLTLVLHSAMDWNGSFHREHALDEIVADRRNLVLLLEGFPSLAAAGAALREAAQRHGQDGQIDQLVFAGHGESRAVELGAARNDAHQLTPDMIDLDANAAASEGLLRDVARLMSKSSAHRRILIHACLTNSNEITPEQKKQALADLPHARELVKASLDARPSLANRMRQLLGEEGREGVVLGANGSTFGGDGAHFIDAKSGALTLADERDPALAADKLAYIEDGLEPHGVMRALVAEWSRNPAAAREALQARLGAADGGRAAKRRRSRPSDAWWPRAVSDVLCMLALQHWEDPATIIALPAMAHPLESMGGDRGIFVDVVEAAIPVAYRAEIFSGSETFSGLSKAQEWQQPFVQIVGEQLLLPVDRGAQTRLLELLAKSYDATAAMSYLSTKLPETILRAPTGPKDGLLIVAAVGAYRDGAATAKTFLRRHLVDGAFPKSLGLARLLGGALSETTLLSVLDAATAATTTEGPANIDSDGDGQLDLRIDPLAMEIPAGRDLVLLASPHEHARPVARVPRGQALRVIGSVGEWGAIAWAQRRLPVFALFPGWPSVKSGRAQFKKNQAAAQSSQHDQ